MQHQIGIAGLEAGARHALPLDIAGRPVAPQPRGIGKDDRIAGEIGPHLDHVPRRARGFGDDGGVAPGDPVEQRRFADIGRADDGDPEALAHHAAAVRRGEPVRQSGGDRLDRRADLRRQVVRQRLVGKVDRRLEPGQAAAQLRAPVRAAFGEGALHLALRLDALGLGLGVDQVGKALGFRQVHPAVLEGPPGELAGLRGPDAVEAAQDREQFADDRRAAMDLEFRDILAGDRAGAGQPQHEPAVDRCAARPVAQRP